MKFFKVFLAMVCCCVSQIGHASPVFFLGCVFGNPSEDRSSIDVPVVTSKVDQLGVMATIQTLDQFRAVVENSKTSLPVIVDFFADWCEPCRAIAPILEELAASYSEQVTVIKFDVTHTTREERLQIAAALPLAQLGISDWGIPLIFFVKNGGVVSALQGSSGNPQEDKNAIEAAIKDLLDKK